MQKPMVFLPTIIGALIGIFISYIGRGTSLITGPTNFLFSGGILALIGLFITFILHFASIDMSRDAYLNQPIDLTPSINYVFSRFLILFLASIVGVILSITLILIPLVSLMFVIMVIDEAGITSSLREAFKVLGADLGDVIIILLVSIIGSIIVGFIPLIGGLLRAALEVIISLAFIDLYYSYKKYH
jgi:hypothetical protein